MKVVYSSSYSKVDIGDHVFPIVKYDLIKKELVKRGHLAEEDFIEPNPANKEEILLVHERDYLEKLKRGTLSQDEIITLEIPYSEKFFLASRICVGGTIMACKLALGERIGVHLGGGFHHAFPDHGEGFCMLNDVAIGAKWLLNKGEVNKILIVDCDLHQGNGTAFIFQKEKRIFTFSIHQENNYPAIKPKSDLDIGLPDGTGDKEYLFHLQKNIPKIIEKFNPNFIIYLAGADPYEEDTLGGLSLTKNGLLERDRFTTGLAKEKNIPISILMAGGYAAKIQDGIEIHINTIKVSLDIK